MKLSVSCTCTDYISACLPRPLDMLNENPLPIEIINFLFAQNKQIKVSVSQHQVSRSDHHHLHLHVCIE